jgi:hypothetical protein
MSTPRILTDDELRISVSSSGDIVFLPSLVTRDDELNQLDQLNGNNHNHPENSQSTSHSTLSSDQSNENLNNNSETILQEQFTHHEDNDLVSHTFAIVLTLYKSTPICSIKAQLRSVCSIQWPKGLPCDHNIKNESFEMGGCSWDLNLSNYNYFVPSVASDNISYDSYEDAIDDSDKFLTEQRIPVSRFEMKSMDQITKSGYVQKQQDDPFVIGALNSQSSVNYPPGDYIFCLPMQFDPSISESLSTLKSNTNYTLRTIVTTKGKNYALGEHVVNILRGPPPIGESTANKPIYINKVWNRALNYEISFPKKYVTIGEQLPMKLNFSPLEKGVVIKRIKINVIEKITYVSKNQEYEYDEERIEYEDGYYKTKKKDKLITLFELKTHPRLTTAIRDEVVDDITSDNLLTSCYHKEPESLDNTEITGNLGIRCYLPFIKPHKTTKQSNLSKELIRSIFFTEKQNNQVNRDLKTTVKNNEVKLNTTAHIAERTDGFFADCDNNRFIKIEHKLQISLRISKINSKDSKVHHYEVMIDTPIYLLNSLCVDENIQLPEYESGRQERLPTFEEATSPFSSPLLAPQVTLSQGLEGNEIVNCLSRTSTMATGSYDEVFDQIDSLMNDNSSLSLNDRRLSVTKSEILNSFRRTLSHPNGGTATDGYTNGNSSDDSEAGFPDEPPSYGDSIPLLSDGEEEDTIDSLNSDHLEEMDLTEQFRIAAFRGTQ